MRFLNNNGEAISGGQGFILSRDIKDICLETTTTANVTLSITCQPGGKSFSFICTPVNNIVPIRLKDIFDNIVSAAELPYAQTWQQAFTVAVSAASLEGQASLYFVTIRGSNGGVSAAPGDILSARPQISKVYDWTKEYVAIVLSSTAEKPLTEVYFRIYPQGLPALDFTIASSSALSPNFIFVIDCSYGAVRAIMDNLGYESVGIAAYDLIIRTTLSDDSTTERRMRFHVMKRDSRVREFCFLNQHGTYDTIAANGATARRLDGELITAVNYGTEYEVHNSHVEKFETSSGYLSTERQVKYWATFLQSTHRYILSAPDSLGARNWEKIIVDEVTESTNELGKIGLFKFVWHYAEPHTGECRTDIGDLEEYQYEKPE